MTIKDWTIEQMTGYKPMTTFYTDFSIADNFGINAIKDTFKGIKKNLKSFDYKYITELSMALNWKIWEHYGKEENKAILYNDLWNEITDWINENFSKEELKYYYRITD